MPKLPNPAQNAACRADRIAALPVDAFDADALDEIYRAGGAFAAALADVTYHHIGDPGSWDCYGPVPDELIRLHAALDVMANAIKTARAQLTAIERRARLAVARGGVR